MAITGASATTTIAASSNLISTGVAAASNLSNIAGNISNAGDVGSQIRLATTDLPSAGESIGDVYAAIAAFSDLEGANEWRVRLSLPTWPSFRTSPVLQPLVSAGGMIFPYTPEISTTNTAKYAPLNLAHTNYNYQAYQHSEAGPITITAPMHVEDTTQGLYWIAAEHFLRSLTKMFNGLDPKAGNPPPIVYLNGYGQYVFANVPVAVTSFQLTLPNDCDYIGVPVVGSAAGVLEGLSDAVGGLANTISSAFPGNSSVTAGASSVASLAGTVSSVAATAALLGLGGSTSGGITHVPTKSSFQVTLQPMYSRQTAMKFSLDRFVEGGYLTSSPGYF
jgi:hypothetical protein